MTSPIKALLFDKDGTLLDFDSTWATPQEKVAEFAAGGDTALATQLLIAGGMDPVTRKTAAGSLFAAGNALEIAEGFVENGSQIAIDVLTEKLDRIFLDGMDVAALLPGLSEVLPRLKSVGYVLGVASSDCEASIAAFLKTTGVSDCFSFISGYDSGYGHKPGPGMVNGFAQATGIPEQEIAVIGDNTHDLEMAAAAGAGLKIGVLSGTGTRADLDPLADLILASAADINVSSHLGG
ncbi:HAD family hydrolase [Labrenzia sp. PHM005]|uniref:HAD family hydrolase n=1 Tax=Labrenzia sp. PHM005 TaxID=2590016 RepID=UPI0011405D0C|nr:HAD family hydrolase [Labrenzia sp. PHM005]QDG76905.1 HAD family hydrolase [Labrenzia sp. PHM005]